MLNRISIYALKHYDKRLLVMVILSSDQHHFRWGVGGPS